MCQRINLDSKSRHRSGARKINLYAIIVVFIISILCSSGPLNDSGLINKPELSETSCASVQNDGLYLKVSYTTTRREAIVDYVRALQAPEGYFHAYLEDPPPFEPDGTDATFSEILDAYGVLKYIDCVDELDWSNTVQFLLSLVDDGFLNMSKRDAPSAYTCWTALTLLPNLEIDADIDINDNAEFVADLQQPDGGFLAKPSNLFPTLVRTYYALDMLRIADRLGFINLAAARSFVVSCYKSDGGFSNSPQEESDFNYAPAGIMLLEILGLQDVLNVNLTTDYLLQFWDNESGCDTDADLLYTQRIAWSLWLLDREDSIDTTKLLQWVLGLQKHFHGEFVGYPEAGLGSDRLVFANYATHILAMYNGTNLLESDFLVEEEPVWTIPQWWIDYINSEWSTSPNDGNGGLFRFVFPDLSFMIALIPYMLIAVAVITPALWITARSRNRQIERRERKRKRKNRQSNG
jgi:prenyltransferase beta subunit